VSIALMPKQEFDCNKHLLGAASANWRGCNASTFYLIEPCPAPGLAVTPNIYAARLRICIRP
jgi:hypothetical protein